MKNKNKNDNNNIDEKDDETNYQTLGISLGMIFGMSIGTSIGKVTDNMSLYMVLGMGIGMLIGAALGTYKKNKNDAEFDDDTDFTDVIDEDADVISDSEEDNSVPYIETPEFRQKVEEWKIQFEKREKEEAERKEKALQDTLNKFKISIEDVEPMTNEANKRNYRDGIYHTDPTAQYGSVDNPIVVGMPECSDTLVFIPECGVWCLTDGLGNGYIR